MRRLFLLSCALVAFSSASFAVSFRNVANGVWNTGLTTSGSNLVLVGDGSVDPNYTLIALPTGCSGIRCQEDATAGNLFGPSTYVVLGGNGQYPLVPGAWNLQNDTSPSGTASKWVGPRADQRNPSTSGTTWNTVEIFASSTSFYAYRMVFNLSALGLIANSANIQLRWLSDNSENFSSPQLRSHIRMCSIGSASDPVCDASFMVPNSFNAGQGASSMTPVSITSGFTGGLMALDFIVYNSVITAPNNNNPSGFRVSIDSAEASDVPEPATVGLIGTALLGLGLLRRRAA